MASLTHLYKKMRFIKDIEEEKKNNKQQQQQQQQKKNNNTHIILSLPIYT